MMECSYIRASYCFCLDTEMPMCSQCQGTASAGITPLVDGGSYTYVRLNGSTPRIHAIHRMHVQV